MRESTLLNRITEFHRQFSFMTVKVTFREEVRKMGINISTDADLGFINAFTPAFEYDDKKRFYSMVSHKGVDLNVTEYTGHEGLSFYRVHINNEGHQVCKLSCGYVNIGGEYTPYIYDMTNNTHYFHQWARNDIRLVMAGLWGTISTGWINCFKDVVKYSRDKKYNVDYSLHKKGEQIQ